MVLKWLVGVACAAVILVAGFWFWDRYQAQLAAEERAHIAMCQKYLDDFVGYMNFSGPRDGLGRRATAFILENSCGYSSADTKAVLARPSTPAPPPPPSGPTEKELCDRAMAEMRSAANGSPILGNMPLAIRKAEECGMVIPDSLRDRFN